MRIIYILFFSCWLHNAKAQELFVFTEPASNMAAKSIGFRLNNYFMKNTHEDRINYHLLPEIMWGVSKNVMIHAEVFLSNQANRFIAEGGSFYAKYRILSKDGVHNHFRVATYGRYVFNNSEIHQPAVDFNGHNSGVEGGLIATQLIGKVALSATSSLLYAKDNGSEKFLFGDDNRTAVSYTFSVGKLLLPKEYTSYKQTNINGMLEILGQTNMGSGLTYLDIAPSVQFIVNSRMRFDIGYRAPIVNKLYREAPRGAFVRIEYNIFNLY